MNFKEELSCDILIAGAGLAGLRAAYDCAKAGLKVIIAVKGKLCSGASFYPLTGGLGSQVALDDADKEVFLSEILEAGAGAADESLCRILVEENEEQVKRLPEIGITYKLDNLSGRAACFAKRERRLAVWRDWQQIRKKATDIFSKMSNVTVMEFTDLLKLVTKHDTISGVILADNVSDLIYVKTTAVILATGGYCGLYKHSLNTDDICGIGHSIALDAGASLINLEFMQFIPGIMSPVYKTLFGEFSLIYCEDVLDENDNHALRKYLPEDIRFEECIKDRSMHGPFTTADKSAYFDLSIMDYCIKSNSEKGFLIKYSKDINNTDNPFLKSYLDFLATKGIVLGRDKIYIAPFAHCANGGIHINANCETGVQGLYAAGEAAGGVHGADRHGGNATSACLVFGKRAAESAIKYAKPFKDSYISSKFAIDSFQESINNNANSAISPQDVLHELKNLLWYYANILRDGKALEESKQKIMDIRTNYNAYRAIASGFDVKISMKAYHALITSEALLTAMLHRQESRGPHYRVDYPYPDTCLYGKRVSIQQKEGKSIVRYI